VAKERSHKKEDLLCRSTSDDIWEFIRLYQEEFGEILPFDEAKRRAAEVMTLFEMIEEDDNEVLNMDLK
jgi:hypothetical protein